MVRLMIALGLSIALTGGAMAETFHADVWVDNWFKFYVNEKPVAEDHVPITTERSFNAESFDFTAKRPFVLNFIVKDFKQNDTGLEYIGTRRQQMGDGGFIAQIMAGGRPVAVTNANWRCLVIHHAPASPQCARERNPVAGKGPCALHQTEGARRVEEPRLRQLPLAQGDRAFRPRGRAEGWL